MNEHISDYFALFALFVVVGVFALLATLVVDIALAVWRRLKHGPSGDDDGDEDWGGGGPGRDIDKQFHEIADAVGKTVEIEKKAREKVLT